MSDAAAAEDAAGAAAGGKTAALVAALTFVGALLGGVVASVVVAPKIIARQVPAMTADSAAAPGEMASGEHGGEGEDGAEGEKKLVELSNIIVNPAGSQGTRFLMASVAFAVGTPEAERILQDRQVEMRDKVTTVLESMTLAQLTAPGARDTLKARIAALAGDLVGKKVPVQVFLPQFVIQ